MPLGMVQKLGLGLEARLEGRGPRAEGEELGSPTRVGKEGLPWLNVYVVLFVVFLVSFEWNRCDYWTYSLIFFPRGRSSNWKGWLSELERESKTRGSL